MDEWPTRATQSGAISVRPEGHLDFGIARRLREQLINLVAGGSTRLVVDLSDVRAIDSSGLGALIMGLKAARQRGGELRIAAPNDQVKAVLQTTNLDGILKSQPGADAAFD
jgi:anti-anti-sigma factor